jgi:hypothetical protein
MYEIRFEVLILSMGLQRHNNFRAFIKKSQQNSMILHFSFSRRYFDNIIVQNG